MDFNLRGFYGFFTICPDGEIPATPHPSRPMVGADKRGTDSLIPPDGFMWQVALTQQLKNVIYLSAEAQGNKGCPFQGSCPGCTTQIKINFPSLNQILAQIIEYRRNKTRSPDSAFSFCKNLLKGLLLNRGHSYLHGSGFSDGFSI